MTGPIQIATGDGQGINAVGDFYINSAEKTIFGLWNGSTIAGHRALPTLIRGNKLVFNDET